METIKREDWEKSYYDKKSVYSTIPLQEIIYEIEDAYRYDSFRDIEYVSKEELCVILHRHSNTVKEFKKRLADVFDK